MQIGPSRARLHLKPGFEKPLSGCAAGFFVLFFFFLPFCLHAAPPLRERRLLLCSDLLLSIRAFVGSRCLLAARGSPCRDAALRRVFKDSEVSGARGDTNNWHEIVGSEGRLVLPEDSASPGFESPRLLLMAQRCRSSPAGGRRGFYGIYSRIATLSHFYEPSRILSNESLTTWHFFSRPYFYEMF